MPARRVVRRANGAASPGMRSAKMRARIARFDIASVKAGLELRQLLPELEDRGVFDDMNYAANAIEPRKAGRTRDRRR